MNYRELNDYELVSKVGESDEIIDILFEKYKPLIMSVADKLYKTNKNIGLDFHDLVQEGMVGFSMAIATFQEHKDTLFFTYAKKCIESKMYAILRTQNTQKHKILNSSISMETIASEDFHASLDKVLSDSSANPESIMVDNENVIEFIEKLTQDLTVFESQVFSLRKSGFTYREIADILDTSPKRIDNALQRIKYKAKSYLETREN